MKVIQKVINNIIVVIGILCITVLLLISRGISFNSVSEYNQVNLSKGSLLLVSSYTEYKIDDIVSYNKLSADYNDKKVYKRNGSSTNAEGRIVSINNAEGSLSYKLNTSSSWLSGKEIYGKVLASIPCMGWVSNVIANPQYSFILIGLLLLLIGASFILERIQGTAK